MALFKFRRKIETSDAYPLEEISIFSSLTPAEQKMIQRAGRVVEFKRGDLVYKEGTPSEAFYVVLSGRFRIYTEARGVPGGETLLYVHRGDHFGETSLLSGHKHSASIEAKRDGLVLRLEKDDFLKFVKEIPSISLHLSRSLGHRLTRTEDSEGRRREVKITALYALSDSDESAIFWFDLASRVVRETSRKVLVIDFVSKHTETIKQELKQNQLKSFDLVEMHPSKDSEIRACIMESPGGFHYLHVPANKLGENSDKKIAALVTHLTYRYDYLLIRLVRDLTHVASQALKRSDDVYVYCPKELDKLATCTEILTEFEKSFAFSPSEIKIVIPDTADGSKISYDEAERLLGRRVFALLPSREQRTEHYHSTLRFLSRELAGMLIGLALGSGAAYGLSHIGVFRVLEREKIPIDIISGSSIGALIGAFWAAGFDSNELEKIAKGINHRNAFFKLIGFADLSLAHRGFIKGKQVMRYLESFLGNMTFQDLRVPVKVIAANLFNSEEVVFEAGNVVEAIRASISIPGIFRPYEYRGEYLIDGGVIDPLPVRVLANRGVKKIIAVNVLASAKDRREQARIKEKAYYQQLKSLAHKNLLSKGVEGSFFKINRHYSVNVFNVIMNTIQFMEYELAQTAGNEADVLIHPKFPEAHWAQFYSSDKFIKAGEENTLEHLDEIKQLLLE